MLEILKKNQLHQKLYGTGAFRVYKNLSNSGTKIPRVYERHNPFNSLLDRLSRGPVVVEKRFKNRSSKTE